MKTNIQMSCVLARTLPSRREGFEQISYRVVEQKICKITLGNC